MRTLNELINEKESAIRMIREPVIPVMRLGSVAGKSYQVDRIHSTQRRKCSRITSPGS